MNYSSQLIFVSGKSVADQQRTLSDFLSSQQVDTEISFFTASNTKQASDYRSKICRQLGGHQVGSFIRPLQQLLGDPQDGLSSQNGPYLVCITQADALEDSFLQELWDWVMYSQQSEQSIHLNIILFGESAWAEKAQEWLPMHNSHKPVLLSSESVNPVGFDVNALEALMADKSSWFSTSNQPMVTNRWFIGGILSVFLLVFVSLMAWQYPSQFSSLLAGDTESATSYKPELESSAKEQAFEGKTQRQIIVDEGLNETSSTKTTYQAPLEVVELESTTSQSTHSNKLEQTNSYTDAALVTSWTKSADKATSINQDMTLKAPVLVSAAMQSDSKSNVDETIPTSSANIALQKETLPQPKVIAKDVTNNPDGDFQVPDIISVEQLDAQFTSQDETQNAYTYNASSEISEDTEQPELALAQEQQSDSGDAYQFDETTLLSLPTDAVVLQLSGIQNPEVLQNYLNDNNLKASTWVYETQRYGGPWYVVLYRQSFGSVDAALDQLSALPEYVKEARPFAKSINQIQQEISRR